MSNKSIIIILVIIFGLSAFYYALTGEIPLKEYIFSNDDNETEEIVADDGLDKQTDNLSGQGNSDTLSEIEVDVDNTDLDDLDRELLEIEALLNGF